MKLTYWVANCLDDSPVYSIRRKTRKAVLEALDDENYDRSSYGKPKKVSIEYRDAFDLMDLCLSGEGRAHWEESWED